MAFCFIKLFSHYEKKKTFLVKFSQCLWNITKWVLCEKDSNVLHVLRVHTYTCMYLYMYMYVYIVYMCVSLWNFPIIFGEFHSKLIVCFIKVSHHRQLLKILDHGFKKIIQGTRTIIRPGISLELCIGLGKATFLDEGHFHENIRMSVGKRLKGQQGHVQMSCIMYTRYVHVRTHSTYMYTYVFFTEYTLYMMYNVTVWMYMYIGL